MFGRRGLAAALSLTLHAIGILLLLIVETGHWSDPDGDALLAVVSLEAPMQWNGLPKPMPKKQLPPPRPSEAAPVPTPLGLPPEPDPIEPPVPKERIDDIPKQAVDPAASDPSLHANAGYGLAGPGIGMGSGDGLGGPIAAGAGVMAGYSTAAGAGNGGRQPGRSGNAGPVERDVGSIDGPFIEKTTQPAYPKFARRMGKEGKVLLSILIDESGKVLQVQVLQGAGFGFDEAAMEAVRVWIFKPATLDGTPVRCRARMLVRFELKDARHE
jgi:protein TonB